MGLRNLLAMCPGKGSFFQTLPRPEKDVCRLQPLAEHRNGWIPFRFARFSFRLLCLRAITDVLTAQATRKHLPSGTIVTFVLYQTNLV